LVNDRFRVLPSESRIPADAFDPLPIKTGWRGYLGLSSVLDSRLRMLEQAGEATLVAEPRLSCRSGGAARFVAGGEIPVPVVNGVGATDVEYREYGVILDVKPIADAGGAISARIETELSQIDPAQRVAGIPGLLKRRSVTDVNLRAGETLVIAGLASRLRSLDDSGIPGLARVPVAGRLFGVRGRRTEDTEVVIFLTPRIAQPMSVESAGAPVAADPADAALERRLLNRAREIVPTDSGAEVQP
jgi:pilus assembly protein CpaC